MNSLQLDYFEAASRLAEKAQRDMQPTVEKTRAAHRIYVGKNASLYTDDEIKIIQHFLDAFLYKFQLANFSLEQLWTIRDAKVEANLMNVVRNLVVSLELTDIEQFLQSHFFEQYLFQSRTCTEFYMLYIALLLQTGHQGHMSHTKFFKRLTGLPKSHPERLLVKAQSVEQYLNANVFGSGDYIDGLYPSNWGELARSLRAKIAHKDMLTVSMNSPDTIMNDILLDFPTIRDLTYDRFCQEIDNGIWCMVRDLFPVLYDIAWQAG